MNNLGAECIGLQQKNETKCYNQLIMKPVVDCKKNNLFTQRIETFNEIH